MPATEVRDETHTLRPFFCVHSQSRFVRYARSMGEKNEVLLRTKRFSVEKRRVPSRSGGEAFKEIVVHPGSVALLPILDDGRIVLVRNTRAAIGRTLWELPAGTRDPGEEPETCGMRELEEETGYRATRLTRLHQFYPAPGICDEVMHAFVADGLVPTQQKLDDSEQIEVHALHPDEVLRMVKAREIEDAKSIAIILFWWTR
jgi:ADP-ribose pyrophosphatase